MQFVNDTHRSETKNGTRAGGTEYLRHHRGKGHLVETSYQQAQPSQHKMKKNVKKHTSEAGKSLAAEDSASSCWSGVRTTHIPCCLRLTIKQRCRFLGSLGEFSSSMLPGRNIRSQSCQIHHKPNELIENVEAIN